jgi:predicted  nucleic acid-binding Zn-ribbon protein
VLTDDLVELQRIDSTVDQLSYRRANLPERAAAETVEAELKRVRGQIAELIARQRELNEAIEDAEQSGAELTRHRERLQGQLRTVTSPREAEALTHELDTLAARRDELDDGELANLDEQARVVEDLAEAHRAEVDIAAAAEAAAAELAATEATIDEQTAKLTVERGDAATRFDPGVLTEYERRRARFGGVAVAKLDGRRCGGCFLDLSTVELAAVQATPPGEYADCPQCGRMLVP